MAYRVNAGRLPADHWTNDPAVGGGRLLGEGCHFVDFLCDQAPGDPLRVSARGFRSDPGLPLLATDNFTLQIDFSDGSAGTVNYAADSPTGPGKERFETSSPGVYAVLDDFSSGEIWRGRRTRQARRQTADKGWRPVRADRRRARGPRRGAARRGLLPLEPGDPRGRPLAEQRRARDGRRDRRSLKDWRSVGAGLQIACVPREPPR